MIANIHFPDHSEYVAGAYLVFLALLLIYVSIMAYKLTRFERELVELNELADSRGSTGHGERTGHE
jgi:hypothetical protein